MWRVERTDLQQEANFERLCAGTPPHERAGFDRVGVDDDDDLRPSVFPQEHKRLRGCIFDLFVHNVTPNLLGLRLRVERNLQSIDLDQSSVPISRSDVGGYSQHYCC
jgi:hypothetical protein